MFHSIIMPTRCAALVVVVLAIGACGGTKPTYEGPRRDASEVATLEVPAKIRKLTIDDRSARGRRLELLPGSHHIEVEAYEMKGAGDRRIRFDATCAGRFGFSAGEAYRLQSWLWEAPAEANTRTKESGTTVNMIVEIAQASTGDVFTRLKCRKTDFDDEARLPDEPGGELDTHPSW